MAPIVGGQSAQAQAFVETRSWTMDSGAVEDGPDGGHTAWACTATIVGAALACFALSWLLVDGSSVAGWEQRTFEAINGLSGPLYGPAEAVMLLGSAWVVVPLAVVLGIVTSSWRAAAATILGVVGAWLLSNVVKETVGRARPAVALSDVVVRGDGVAGPGFVSGHSTVAFAAATVVAAVLPGRWKVVPFALATLVAVARMYVGVHFPLDVIGGAALGIACSTCALRATGVTRRRS